MPHRVKSLPIRVLAAALSCLLAMPAALVSSLASAASPASAGPPTLIVVGIPLDEAAVPVAARLAFLGEQVARRLGRHQVLDLADQLDAENTQLRAERGQQGKTDYGAARQAYDDLEVGKAAELCGRALELLEKADQTSHFDELVRAWVLKVASLIANAEYKQAVAELALLLTVDPKTPFDPNLFAPDFLAQVRREREALLQKSTLALDVQSRPVPARVYLDGTFRGVAPVELRQLAPGDHLLTAIAPGYLRVQRRVRPGAGVSESLALEPAPKLKSLSGAIARIRADLRGEGRNRAARDLARELGAAQVLVVTVGSREKELKALAVRVDGEQGRELSYLEEPLPDDEARFQTAAEGLLERVISKDLSRGRTTTGGGFEWTSRHTGYALLGLGLGAAVAGTLFGLAARADANHYKSRTEAQTDSSYSMLERSGRRNALVADISFLGAIILGGTGAYLAVTGRGVAARDEANLNLEEKRSVAGVRSRAEDEEAAEPARAAPSRLEPAARPRPAPAADKKPSAPPAQKPDKKKPGEDEHDDLRDDR
jgi:hypothetical protein